MVEGDNLAAFYSPPCLYRCPLNPRDDFDPFFRPSKLYTLALKAIFLVNLVVLNLQTNLSSVRDTNLAEVRHKVVDVRHLDVQGLNLRHPAQDHLGDQEHGVLD